LKHIRHFIEYLLAFVLVLVLVFAIASVIIVKFYGDDVKEYALQTINQQVETKVQVEAIGIGIFRNFPYTSVFFNDVVVWSGYGFQRDEFSEGQRDTLLTARSVSLQFNLFDLVRRQYDVRSLSITGGAVRLLTDSTGGNNYTVRASSSKKEQNELLVDLRAVKLKNIHLELANHAKQLESRFLLEDVDLSGNFSSDQYRLSLSGSALLETWVSAGIEYFSDQQFESDVSFSVRDNLYTISRGIIDLGYILADVNGNLLIAKESGVDLDLHLEAQKVDIPWILDLLGRQGSLKTGDIKARGTADILADITGIVSPLLSPHIEASYTFLASDVSADFLPYSLSSLEFAGNYSNGRFNALSSTLINLHTLNVETKLSSVHASLRLENLERPVYYAEIEGEIDARDLNEIINGVPVTIASGMLRPSLSLSGMINGLTGGRKEVTFIPGGEMSFTDLALKVSEPGINLHSLTGNMNVDHYVWETSVSGFIEQSDVLLDVKHTNPIGFFLGSDDLDIQALLKSDRIFLDELLPKKKKNAAQKKLQLPDRLFLRMDMDVGELIYNETPARNIRGRLRYRYPSLFIDDLQLEAWNGEIEGRAGITMLDQPVKKLTVNAEGNSLDIHSFFSTFDNFNQEAITSENLRGSVSLVSEFAATLDSENRLEKSSIVSENQVEIKNGELIHFEPLDAVYRLLKIDRMDKVTFSTLKNNILIRNNLITIPEMNINSSAFNISASGIQGFDKTYKYHLAVKLSEILFRKAQGAANREFEIALDEEDRRTVFLILYDEGKGVTVEFDEEKAVRKLRNDLREEKLELKTILNEEFGVFSRDTSVMKRQESTPDPIMKFEFTDEPEKEVQKEAPEKNRWWQKGEDKKKKLDLVLEDDGL
jgi:hypothetical protein